MSRNMGTLDRALRIVIGLMALWLAFFSTTAFAQGGLFWLAVVVGVIMLLTSVVGNCPLYRLIGVKTCKDC